MDEAYAFKCGASRHRAMLGVADWIALAAAPTFTVLVIFTFVLEAGPPDMLCSTTQHASPLNGMAVMYVLMSVFHSTPWLRLVSMRSSSVLPT